jgi:AraC-like DNA-binding protein
MIFEYKNVELDHILEKFAKGINATVVNKTVTYPSNFGEGYLKGVSLPSGINFAIFEYKYYKDLLVQHIAYDKEQYMIWFDISHSLEPLVLSVNEEEVVYNDVINMSAALLNSFFSFSHLRTKGANGYGVMVFLHKKILQKFISTSKWETVLQWFFDIKMSKLDLIKITDAEKTLIDDIIKATNKENNYINLEKRIYQLLELFFLRVFKVYKENNKEGILTLPEATILGNVESLISKYYMSDEVDFVRLESEIGMTRHNLEKLIKRAFNKTLPDYIKFFKMQNAYQQVLNTQKDIQEIAYEMGYANPSNFSNAFKKQFGAKPSELR